MTDEREIEVTFSPAEYAAIKRAADMAGETVEEFIVRGAEVRARESLRLLDDYPSDN